MLKWLFEGVSEGKDRYGVLSHQVVMHEPVISNNNDMNIKLVYILINRTKWIRFTPKNEFSRIGFIELMLMLKKLSKMEKSRTNTNPSLIFSQKFFKTDHLAQDKSHLAFRETSDGYWFYERNSPFGCVRSLYKASFRTHPGKHCFGMSKLFSKIIFHQSFLWLQQNQKNTRLHVCNKV